MLSLIEIASFKTHFETSFAGPSKGPVKLVSNRGVPSPSDLGEYWEECRMEKVLNTCLVVNTDSSEGQRAMEIFREQYNKAGLTEGAAWILNNHPVFAEYLRMGISLFSKERPEYFLVRPALEADFITPEEINKAYPDVVYADAQIAHLVRSLPSIGELKWRKQFGYAEMPAPPKAMSLLDIRANNVNDFYSRSGGWYAGRRFASDDETSPGWLAIKKTPVVNSFNREWDSQKRLLLRSEEHT